MSGDRLKTLRTANFLTWTHLPGSTRVSERFYACATQIPRRTQLSAHAETARWTQPNLCWSGRLLAVAEPVALGTLHA